MPITDDIMDHDVLGPEFRAGLQKGREEGRQEGELDFVKRMLSRRFGTLPSLIEERLHKLSPTEREDLFLRLANAKSLDDVFNPEP